MSFSAPTFGNFENIEELDLVEIEEMMLREAIQRSLQDAPSSPPPNDSLPSPLSFATSILHNNDIASTDTDKITNSPNNTEEEETQLIVLGDEDPLSEKDEESLEVDSDISLTNSSYSTNYGSTTEGATTPAHNSALQSLNDTNTNTSQLSQDEDGEDTSSLSSLSTPFNLTENQTDSSQGTRIGVVQSEHTQDDFSEDPFEASVDEMGMLMDRTLESNSEEEVLLKRKKAKV